MHGFYKAQWNEGYLYVRLFIEVARDERPLTDGKETMELKQNKSA